jgi:phosphatidylglycerol lysyltransferase
MLAGAQILLAGCDWTVAALVLRVLLPESSALPLPAFLGAFVLSQLAGVVSQVPGGVGVFEATMLLALRTALPVEQAMAALAANRAICYLVPFGLATATLVLIETVGRPAQRAMRGTLHGIRSGAVRWTCATGTLLPTVLGASTFIGGGMLLLSGATPAVRGRMRLLESVLPLGLIEFSTVSLAGVGLLVLGWGLHRRLDAVWGMTLTLLGAGIVASLLKGLDWEEAGILARVVLVLLPARNAFYRHATLTSEPLTPEWIAVLAVVGTSVALGMLAYRHVESSNELWWQFAVDGAAPRFLRASTGSLVALLALGWWRLLRSPSYSPEPATAAQLARAASLIAQSSDSTPALALLGDKSLPFTDARSSCTVSADGAGSRSATP